MNFAVLLWINIVRDHYIRMYVLFYTLWSINLFYSSSDLLVCMERTLCTALIKSDIILAGLAIVVGSLSESS